LFVGSLISNKFDSKVCFFLGGWVGGFKLVSAVMGETFWWLVVVGDSLYMSREIVHGSLMYSGGGSFLKVEGDRSS
jgi:hypothetical protein